MSNSSLRVKVPGKLMIAGEYAVLEPKQKSVVVAVNRYVTVDISFSDKNSLSIPQLGLDNIAWEISDGGIEFSQYDSRLKFLQSSIVLAVRFLKENSVRVFPFQLNINSQLDDLDSGKKYGLGSSAAVVTAAISAILYLHNFEKTDTRLDEIFKLSALAHLKTQGSGSGADIAAAVYGGWLEYSAFDAKWILEELEQGESLRSLVEKPWQNLYIRKIKPPDSLKLAVGWTKEAAATAPLIKRVHEFRDRNREAYRKFLEESRISVASLIHSFEIGGYEEAIIALLQNRKALQQLAEAAHIEIETDELNNLCSIAESFGSGKSSGAGGGDCGIAFIKDEVLRAELYKAWETAGITPLDLKVSDAGVAMTRHA